MALCKKKWKKEHNRLSFLLLFSVAKTRGGEGENSGVMMAPIKRAREARHLRHSKSKSRKRHIKKNENRKSANNFRLFSLSESVFIVGWIAISECQLSSDVNVVE